MPSLRPLNPHELPRLRAFLPAPAGARYLVAMDRLEPSPERLVGAAAWWPSGLPMGSAEGNIPWFCRWYITPRWEAPHQSLLEEMLGEMVALATGDGARRLLSADIFTEGSPSAARLKASGWQVDESYEFFEGRTSVIWPRVDGLYQRLATSPKSAASLGGLRTVPPSPELFPAVRSLVLPGGLVPVELLERRLHFLDQTGGYSRLTSPVLVTTGPHPAVVAVLLMRMDASIATIDARVADPVICAQAGVTTGQANLLLFHSVGKGLRAGGVEFMRFQANLKEHHETLNLARRCGAEQVGASCSWQYKVA